MIVNTGARTDTVQYYTDWLLRRFAEGYVLSRNPLFPNKVTRYELTPEKVDCVVFCSKNYAPILPRLHEITERFPTYFYYTITAYGKDVEPGVPSIEQSMETLMALSKQVGKGRVAWRYDPVLLTRKYTIERHMETFERMAATLAPHIDRCIFSFVEMYKKLESNMPEIIPFSDWEMDEVARGLGAIAQKYGVSLQTCGTNGDYSRYGIHPSGCMTLDILGRANGIEFKDLKHKGSRQGCHCIESRDIGAYDTCLKRLQVLLRQQKSPFGLSELQAARPRLAAAAWTLAAGGHHRAGGAEVVSQGGAAWLSIPWARRRCTRRFCAHTASRAGGRRTPIPSSFNPYWYRTRPGAMWKRPARPSAGGCGRRSLGNFRRRNWKRSSAPAGFAGERRAPSGR